MQFVAVVDDGAIHVYQMGVADATQTYLGKFEDVALAGTSNVLLPWLHESLAYFIYNPDTGKLVTLTLDFLDIPGGSAVTHNVTVSGVTNFDSAGGGLIMVADAAGDRVRLVDTTTGSDADTMTSAALVGVNHVMNTGSQAAAAGPNGLTSITYDFFAETIDVDESVSIGMSSVAGLVGLFVEPHPIGIASGTPTFKEMDYSTPLSVFATDTFSPTPTGVARAGLYGYFVSDSTAYYGKYDVDTLSGSRGLPGIPYSKIATTYYTDGLGDIYTTAHILIPAQKLIDTVDITTISSYLT